MGYVPASFLKAINPEVYKNLTDGEYLYPLYDIRHFILAAKICDSIDKEPERVELLNRLVATKEVIIPILLGRIRAGTPRRKRCYWINYWKILPRI